MIYFFTQHQTVFAVSSSSKIDEKDIEKLKWLFGNAEKLSETSIAGSFIGPRKEMVSPWSTNAVEITQNMGISGISRIEEFFKTTEDKPVFDAMIQHHYKQLDQDLFTVHLSPEAIKEIDDITAYNKAEGLALNEDEVTYLNDLAHKLGRKLTDSEIFGFSQVNSEHCRHKIFNGTFVIDGKEQPNSLFKMIKKTSIENPNTIVSAYKDNVAFIEGLLLSNLHQKQLTNQIIIRLKK